MLCTKPAVLLILNSARLFSLVLGSRVIPMLADSALERNNVSHNLSYS